MANHVMVSPDEAIALGLNGTLVEEDAYLAAKGKAAAAADAAIFLDGPQEPQEDASEPPEVDPVPSTPRRPRRARRPAGGDDAGQFVPDDPTTPQNEAYEADEA